MASLRRTARRALSRTKKKAATACGMWFRLRHHYAWHYKNSKVEDKTILFESFHGKTMSDSPLYMLREFVAEPRSAGFKIYYTTTLENLETHRRLASELGLDDIEFVVIESWKYARILATTKYFVNNSSFPAYFTLRPEQRYIQTWHGTPLKTLGKQMRMGIESMYNVQHNFLQASYLTFPNEFTRDVMMRDYNLEDLYTGKVALLGYPRNQVFFDDDCAKRIRERYNLDGFELFAYMPTWRGANNYTVNVDDYREEVMGYLAHVDEVLRDDQLMFVNFHNMVASQIGSFSFDHILPFPADADNYEFLNACDVLVTDYSSVFFDFSITRKPVLMFIYDKDEYLEERGMYLDIEELPFPKARTIDELCEQISSGAYKHASYAGTDYEHDFLRFDTSNNARKALDLLLEGAADGVELADYARNAQRSWNTLEPYNQRELADIRTACVAADPERDIVLFLKNRFTTGKSAFLHDEHRDEFNYVFITKAYNCTAIEEILRPRSKHMEEVINERERQRLFPNLDVPAQPVKNVYTGVEETNFIWPEADIITLDATAAREEDHLVIDVDFGDFKPRGIAAIRRRKVKWRRELTKAEVESGRIVETFTDLFTNETVGNGARLKIYLDGTLGEDGPFTIANIALANEAASFDDDKMDTLFDPLVFDPPADMDPEALVLGQPLEHIRERIELDGDAPVIVPYKNNVGRLSVIAGYRHQYYTRFKRALLETIRARGDEAYLRLRMREGDFVVEDLIVKLRNDTNFAEVGLPYTLTHKDGWIHIESTFKPSELPLQEIYWDARVVIRHHGSRGLVPIVMTPMHRRKLCISNQQWRVGEDKVFFTHIAKGRRVAFVFRDYYPTLDTYALRLKEFAALGTFAALHPYWKRKRMWLVYEKFCKLAQDNGYYFFEYCMSLPPEQRDHIYFVIDKSQPDYDFVKQFDDHVIDFMSFKHILYTMVAKLYIASDSRTHLYVWRNKPSFVRTRMGKHRIFFLQHGVTAMKQVANLFGKRGSNPMTYFLTTSKREQDIVVGNFGYTKPYAPILGFSRWDALEDKSSPEAPQILLMPTWRPWLEEQDDDFFVQSDYFKVYSSLIQSKELAAVLEKHNATLRFFIHPKLSEQLRNFEVASPRVELVEQGSEPLNQVMMRCNMVVTDYSSVCWDMLYMDKPVIFYHFDQELYEKVVGSYVNLDEDLPGYICKTEAEVVSALDDCAARGFTLTAEQASVADSWFAHKDQANRERTYNYIVKRGY